MRNDPVNLSRNEMVMVMHDQEQEIERLRARVRELQSQLNEYEHKFSEAGSLAEIAAHITRLYTAAQATADIYLDNIKKKSDRTEAILAEVEAQADAIISEAEEVAKKRIEAAEAKAAKLPSPRK